MLYTTITGGAGGAEVALLVYCGDRDVGSAVPAALTMSYTISYGGAGGIFEGPCCGGRDVVLAALVAVALWRPLPSEVFCTSSFAGIYASRRCAGWVLLGVTVPILCIYLVSVGVLVGYLFFFIVVGVVLSLNAKLLCLWFGLLCG